jgi:hypothetical protein
MGSTQTYRNLEVGFHRPFLMYAPVLSEHYMAVTTPSLCVALAATVPEVVGRWHGMPATAEAIPPPEDTAESAERLVLAIIHASLGADREGDPHAEQLRAAAEHGAARRAEGAPEELVLTEYDQLRTALWVQISALSASPETALAAISQIDRTLAAAVRGALLGYHRTEFETMGRWPDRLELLIAESRPSH